MKGDLDALAKFYLDSLTVRGSSKTTIRKYAHVLDEFVSWARNQLIALPIEVDLATLELHRIHLAERLQPQTVRHSLVIIRGFFRFLRKRKIIVQNPADGLELGPKIQHHRMPLSHEDMERIIAQIDTTELWGLHDRAMIETLYSTATRASELSAMTAQDIDASGGFVFVRQGKGGKDRVVPIGARALMWLSRYFESARSQLLDDPDHNHGIVFLRLSGRPIIGDRVTHQVRHYAKQAGIERQACSHVVRHTAATVMLENGADSSSIQELLGHACLSTTQVYTNIAITELKAIHAKTHPAGRVGTTQPISIGPRASKNRPRVARKRRKA